MDVRGDGDWLSEDGDAAAELSGVIGCGLRGDGVAIGGDASVNGAANDGFISWLRYGYALVPNNPKLNLDREMILFIYSITIVNWCSINTHLPHPQTPNKARATSMVFPLLFPQKIRS